MFLSIRGIILYSAHVLGHILQITLILGCPNCFKKSPLNVTNLQKSLKSSLLLFSFQINDNAKTNQPNKQINPTFCCTYKLSFMWKTIMWCMLCGETVNVNIECYLYIEHYKPQAFQSNSCTISLILWHAFPCFAE